LNVVRPLLFSYFGFPTSLTICRNFLGFFAWQFWWSCCCVKGTNSSSSSSSSFGEGFGSGVSGKASVPWEIQQPRKDEHAIIKVSSILCLSDRREIIELEKIGRDLYTA
jgi:hypothetical protein